MDDFAETGRSKIKAAKNKQIRSRISVCHNPELAISASENDDFRTIVKHRLLRRKSLKAALPPQIVKTIYEIQREQLDHVTMRTAEQLEKDRKRMELKTADLRRKLNMAEMSKQRSRREEIEKQIMEEEERIRQIQEEEERRRLDKEAKEREVLEREERREKLEREAAERRAALERQVLENEARERKERREAYERKLAAVLDATSEKDREKALREVGKLTILDFGTQEEWESHQKEVGKLNILEIAGQFKKKGRKKKSKRRQTQSIKWSNAKAVISKFAECEAKDEVVRFVKPTAVDLSDLGCYMDGDDFPSPSPTTRSDDLATPDSGLGGFGRGSETEIFDLKD